MRFGWWYAENMCIENNTNRIHVYTTNYTHYLHLNSTVRSINIPPDRSNFREVLRVEPHFGTVPSSLKSVDGLYVIMGRGWNNMYHHSEWSIQLVRYVLWSSFFPPVVSVDQSHREMKTVVLFPDIDFINHRTHDFKGHFRYARGYQDLVMDTFKADLNGVDRTPHYVEHEEYVKANSIICSPQAVR